MGAPSVRSERVPISVPLHFWSSGPLQPESAREDARCAPSVVRSGEACIVRCGWQLSHLYIDDLPPELPEGVVRMASAGRGCAPWERSGRGQRRASKTSASEGGL